MSAEDPGEGFLARWSRRKRAAEVEPASLEATPATEPGGDTVEAPPAAPLRPACPIPNLPAIDPASLPAIDELTVESDFSPFLRPGVPSLLRQAALRRMWSLDTSIRDYIGPVEYQWDFNAPGGLPHGFASELGDGLRQLLAQAIGAPDPDAPVQVPSAPDDAEEPGLGAEEETVPAAADPPSRAEPAAAVPMAEAPAAAPEPFHPPRRRHGGALPV
jgi:hypothetical protein